MLYFTIWKDRAFTWIFLGTTLGRFAQYMFDVSFVIFIIQSLHDPSLAGLSIFFATVPGLILSPMCGSFLANKNQTYWMGVDFLLKSVICISLASYGYSTGNLIISILSFLFSITSAFSTVTLRSYIAFQLSTAMKGIANGLDAVSTGLADIIGPALAGLCCALWDGRIAIYLVGGIYISAATISLLAGLSRALRKMTRTVDTEMNIQIALQSIFFIVKHPLLRTMTLVYFLYQMTIGMITMLLPEIITLEHLNSGWMGICWSITGITGIIASFLAGYLSQYGKDVFLISCGAGITLISSLVLVGNSSLHSSHLLKILLFTFALLGLSVGAIDVGILGLRQTFLPIRGATTILAVSYSLNMTGFPVGTFIIGLISHISLRIQLIATTSIILLTFLLSMILHLFRHTFQSNHSNETFPKHLG